MKRRVKNLSVYDVVLKKFATAADRLAQVALAKGSL